MMLLPSILSVIKYFAIAINEQLVTDRKKNVNQSEILSSNF